MGSRAGEVSRRVFLLFVFATSAAAVFPLAQRATMSGRQVPTFRVDPMWPKPLPNRWIIGAVAGVAVDKRDHVWITHRPSTLQPNETRSIWKSAPPVLEFDASGTLVSSWGGPGAGYEWPQLEHGIYIDDNDHVWLGAGGEKDAHILKFTRDGRFLMQIGHQGQGRGSNDTQNLGAPANMVVDPAASEVYVADGYVNHRIIVFDAATGAYKRHWGAYGNAPDDGFFTRAGEKLPGPFRGVVQNENRPSQYDPNGPPSPQFRIVHAVRISRDGLVYVCDRTNNRLQVFNKDGRFVKETVIAKETLGSGSVWDVGFSTDPKQAFLFINDGTNQLIYVLDRDTLQVVSTFGGAGHWAGQFYGAHNLAVNSRGDLFITETYEGKRVQRFTYTGLGAPSVAP
jgi:DNA-binding beta-propeller fold protein YncE